MSYSPLLLLFPEKDLMELLDICLNNMPPMKDLPEDVTLLKLDLLKKTVNSPLFTKDGKCNTSLFLKSKTFDIHFTLSQMTNFLFF